MRAKWQRLMGGRLYTFACDHSINGFIETFAFLLWEFSQQQPMEEFLFRNSGRTSDEDKVSSMCFCDL